MTTTDSPVPPQGLIPTPLLETRGVCVCGWCRFFLFGCFLVFCFVWVFWRLFCLFMWVLLQYQSLGSGIGYYYKRTKEINSLHKVPISHKPEVSHHSLHLLFQAVYYIAPSIQIFTIFFLLCQNGYFFTFRKIK